MNYSKKARREIAAALKKAQPKLWNGRWAASQLGACIIPNTTADGMDQLIEEFST